MFWVFTILQILPFIIVPIIIISFAIRFRKHSKKINDFASRTFKNTISNANDPNSFGNSNQDLSVYCDYCGSKMERVRKRCPSCGARVQKKDNLK